MGPDVANFGEAMRGKAENVWMCMIAECPWGSVIVATVVCLVTASLLSRLMAKWSFGAKAGFRRGKKLHLAPGPPAWPIVGNLLQLRSRPHRGLAKMAEKYGELMTVQMGSVRTLVVSSPTAAKEILVTQGTTFASRQRNLTLDALTLGGRDLGFAPYGALWRKHRKIAAVQMFSPRRMAQTEAIQRKLIDCLEEELLTKGRGSHKQEEGKTGRKEGEQDMRTSTGSSPAVAKLGEISSVDNGNRGRVTDFHADGNGWDCSAKSIDTLEPKLLRENIFCFNLDTLTYLIFGTPVSPAMRRRVSRALAKDIQSRTTLMSTGVKQDAVESPANKTTEGPLQTKVGDNLHVDHASGGDDRIAKKFYDIIVGMVVALSIGRIHDFVPSLRWFYRGHLRHLSGLRVRIQSLILELVERRRECLRKDVVGDSTSSYITQDQGQAAMRSAGFSNPDAMVDVLFDNLSPTGTSAAKNLTSTSVKHDGVAYGETEACLLIQNLLVAGTDTTTSATTFLLLELLCHPEKMAKLKVEIDEAAAVGMHNAPSVNDLPYLNAVLYETLRMHGPTPLLVPRQSIKDAVVFGYDVPAGTQVIINGWAIMHDPKVWSEPWEFRPERFIRDGRLAEDVHPDGKHFELLPFGSGIRVCPGMQFALNTVRLVVFRLLLRFDLMLPCGMKPEDVDLTERDGIAIFPQNPVPIIFRPREIR